MIGSLREERADLATPCIETFAKMQADLNRQTVRFYQLLQNLQDTAEQALPEIENLSLLMIDDKTVTIDADSGDASSGHQNARAVDNRPRFG